MFGRMMNNYYYGKSGKGDFRKEDMPETRMQLFRDTLRTRLSSLCRLNLIYMLIWLPAMILIMLMIWNMAETNAEDTVVKNSNYAEYCTILQENSQEPRFSEEEFEYKKAFLEFMDMDYGTYVESMEEEGYEEIPGEAVFLQAREELKSRYYKTPLMKNLALLALFIAITGPFTAGVCYVTRNWARDEHAFVWTDFKDAVKANWKIPLVLSTITGLMPLILYTGLDFYGTNTAGSLIWYIPIILLGMIGFIWTLGITYMHPLTVTYDLKLKDVIRNGFLLGIARLPFSIGIRLLHCVPALICASASILFGLNFVIAIMILGGYYILIGFALSRFITASYTNAVFDRYINQRIAGAKVNQGMKEPEDDDYEDEDGEPDQAGGEPGKE